MLGDGKLLIDATVPPPIPRTCTSISGTFFGKRGAATSVLPNNLVIDFTVVVYLLIHPSLRSRTCTESGIHLYFLAVLHFPSVLSCPSSLIPLEGVWGVGSAACSPVGLGRVRPRSTYMGAFEVKMTHPPTTTLTEFLTVKCYQNIQNDTFRF